MSKFADDPKLGHKANCEQNHISNQSDLNTLVDWVDKWKINFNVEKRTYLHWNPQYKLDYLMVEQHLTEVNLHRYLGI